MTELIHIMADEENGVNYQFDGEPLKLLGYLKLAEIEILKQMNETIVGGEDNELQ